MTATYTIDSITMKLFGKRGVVYRGLKNGCVVKVFDCNEAAVAWLKGQQ